MNRDIDEQLEELRGKLRVAEGQYEGTIELAAPPAGGTRIVPIHISLHLMEKIEGQKPDGTALRKPQLVGRFRYRDGRIEPIEYMDFSASYDDITGQFSMVFDGATGGAPGPNSGQIDFGEADRSEIRGEIRSENLVADYWIPSGKFGSVRAIRTSRAVLGETLTQRWLDFQNRLQALYDGITGIYRGELFRTKNNRTEKIPVEMAIHSIRVLDSEKPDGTPLARPKLVGRFRYHDGRVEPIEYMDFSASFESTTGLFSMIYEGGGGNSEPGNGPGLDFGLAERSELRGTISQDNFVGEFILQNGKYGQLKLTKISQEVPGQTRAERWLEFQDRKEKLYRRLAGEYSGRVKGLDGRDAYPLNFIFSVVREPWVAIRVRIIRPDLDDPGTHRWGLAEYNFDNSSVRVFAGNNTGGGPPGVPGGGYFSAFGSLEFTRNGRTLRLPSVVDHRGPQGSWVGTAKSASP